jgi:hypothetical protein
VAEYSETSDEARRRATRAMLDNIYKQTADSRGEMMRASRRAYTDSPERGMSPDGEAAAADARAMADDLVRGSSAPARARLGVSAPSAPAPSAPSMQAKRAPGGPSGKSGGDAYIQSQETAARMAAQREQARRERAMADVDERRDAGLFSDEGYRRAIEAMRNGQNVDSTRADLKARHEAGLLSDLEYMRAAEALNR